MNLFAELGLLIVLVLAVSFVMRIFKQPLIVGHILTGLIAGPYLISHSSIEIFNLFSEIGIAILLFTVGINLSPKTIKEFGRVSLITGVGQVVFTTAVGYFLALLLGFTHLASLYIGVALAFSSTIIILKLLSDKGEIETLYAKISIGFLLVQDFIVIILLFCIPIFSVENISITLAMWKLFFGFVLISVVLGFSFYFIPKINKFISSNSEFLLIFAIAWGIGIANIFKMAEFSIETGALIAGIALSTIPARYEISSRMTPLRDFFIVIFFVLLGSKMSFLGIADMWKEAGIFSILVIVGNPLILMIIMGVIGYKKRTSFKTGLTVGQISEFSLILMAMGLTYGHVSEDALSLVTLVGFITIFVSSYLIMHSETIFKFLEPLLGIFEKRNTHETRVKHKRYSIMVFGGGRVGHDFIEKFKNLEKSFLVVEHDPELVENLTKQGIDVLYGDAGNSDFLETLDLSGLELVVSTIPESETNILINKIVKGRKPEALIVVVAHKVGDALNHYNDGVDYVILPHFLGAKYASDLVVKMQEDREKYEKVKEKHIKSLELRLSLGHEHPVVGK